MNISTYILLNTEYFIFESGGHTHIRNSQPYQLHASTHALIGQAFFNNNNNNNNKSTTGYRYIFCAFLPMM